MGAGGRVPEERRGRGKALLFRVEVHLHPLSPEEKARRKTTDDLSEEGKSSWSTFLSMYAGSNTSLAFFRHREQRKDNPDSRKKLKTGKCHDTLPLPSLVVEEILPQRVGDSSCPDSPPLPSERTTEETRGGYLSFFSKSRRNEAHRRKSIQMRR